MAPAAVPDASTYPTPLILRMKRTADQRFPWLLAATLAAALAAACGGGGGGGGDGVPPRLVGAAFAGIGPTPLQNDLLVLSCSEDVTAATGTAVGTSVLTLSSGNLGTGCVVQDQPTTRSVRLRLGSGVSFTPGVTTIAFAPTNNVIKDTSGNFGTGTDTVVIATSDGAAPTIGNLTLNAIDGILNGTGPAGGTLQVPQNGWNIDVAYADTGAPTPLGVDATRTQITASVAVGSSSGSQPPGANLTPFLVPVIATSTAARWTVPASTTFGTGPVTLTVTVVDGGGLQSSPATFHLTVHAWTDALRPFETTVNSQQVWLLETTRDIESFTTSPITGGATINIVTTPNGRADWLDILFVLGLQSTTPIANVIGNQNSNDIVLQRFQAAILSNLGTLYTGTNVTFTFTQPSGSFGSNSSVLYASLGYSQICLGGSDNNSGVDILGVAQLDPNNQRQNNDCLLESPNNVRLGVFLHTIADDGLGPPAVSSFRQAFNLFAPAVGGTPIGNQSGDDSRLTGATTDTRSSRLDSAISGLARFVAVVLAHECGHSMGLVMNGAMPVGLYGGDPVNFPGSTDGHIRTQSLFPSGGTNVMSPQLSYDLATDSHTAFNSLNIAYLREQAFYGN